MVPIDSVSSLIRNASADIILPRFCNLAEGEVSRKESGEIVTIADHEMEARLAKSLTALVPGSVVVGEEAVTADESLLAALAGNDPVWVIDPVDGTRNFSNGNPCFAVILAYCEKGDVRVGWIHDPVSGAMVTAEEGSGAWEDGKRLRVAPEVPVGQMAGTLGGKLRERTEKRRAEGDMTMPEKMVRLRCAGQQYMALVRGSLHFSRYGMLKPWDHAAGILIHREAGGYSAFTEGGRGPYRPKGGIVQGPLLLAPSERSWHALEDLLSRV
jgi:fructose-1,6-bisphosphatase/inositol monophosphatase family enzyme